MRNYSIPAIVLASSLAFGNAVAAQEAVDAPATTEAPSVVVVAPEGFTVAEFGSVTGEQLQGVDIYDIEGNAIAEINDVVIGTDNTVTGIVTDVGGFLGMGEHRILLNPDQVQIYKNADDEVRAFVLMSKDQLEALPAYEAP